MSKLKTRKPLIKANAAAALIIAAVLAITWACNFYGDVLLLFFGTVGGSSAQSQTYTSAFSNTADLRATQEDFAVTLASEGAVLLKNENAALPLAKGAKVTLLGSQTWYNTGTGSGSVASGEYGYITPKWSLEQVGFSVKPSREDYAGYQDAAIYIISRVGGEGQDCVLNDETSTRYLALTSAEKDELAAIRNAGFGKIVVILNTCNAINMDFADQEAYGVDACLWMGVTGCTGLTALGRILDGQVNPSGHLVDTYLLDNTKNPAMQNFGAMTYEGTNIPYVNYVEGIYLGYKYFETRYEDAIMGTPNVGDYDYDAVVYRPFGYGMSYTTFDWKDYKLSVANDGTATVSVTVTNTGAVAGKEVVQVYFQAPYTDYDKTNLVEKAAVNLADFAKTSLLAPGASETVTISFNARETMKSYDANGEKTYILDAGDYYITAAKDAHAAANNILSAKGYSVDGNAALVDTWNVSAFTVLSSDSVTGTAVTNLFDDAVAQDTEYLSRQNWSRVEEGLTYTAHGTNLDNLAAWYGRSGWMAAGRPNSANSTSEFATGASGDLTFSDMAGAAYDDPRWETLLDKMTITEMHDMFKRAGYTTAAVASIGKQRTYDFDGPAGIVNYVSGWSSFGYPSETLLASTWNVELAERMGELVGEDGLRADIQGWYAPSMNLHRTALSGRNYEYYSEDGVISGLMGAAEVKGARSKGLFVYIKHFAINDQETNRAAVCTWLPEQALREIYLKPFEISVKQGGATGVMGSMNRIGFRRTVGSHALMTSLLRNEWGFRGAIVTDFTTYSAADADQLLAAGTDLILQTSEVPLTRTNSWTRRNALRNAAHDTLYMVANSVGVDAGESGFPVWRIGLYVLWALAALAIILMEIIAIRHAKNGVPEKTPAQKKRHRIIVIVIVAVVVIAIAAVALYFYNYYMSKQI